MCSRNTRWYKKCSFTWNNKRFKDPADWFAKMKEKGVVVSPNVKPGMLLVHPYLEDMKKKDMFVYDSVKDEPGKGTWWGRHRRICRFYKG